MKNEYVKSDGTVEMSEKIKQYFLNIGIEPAEVSKYDFTNITAKYYYVDNGMIVISRTPPSGYTEVKL